MDKFNSEGYIDLTAYEALLKIEQEERAARKAANFRPLVYICSPYSGNIEDSIKTNLTDETEKRIIPSCSLLMLNPCIILNLLSQMFRRVYGKYRL